VEHARAHEPATTEIAARAVAPEVRGGEIAHALTLQRRIGNRAASRQLSRVPKEVAVGAEKVMVESDAETEEATKLIEGMKSAYGVEISSAQGVKSTLATYKDAPEAERNKVKARPWLMSELRSLNKALKHFEPILGAKRATSTRKDAAQEISTAGKVTFSIDSNDATGKVDSTLGQYYRDDKNFSMYKLNETSTVDFPGNKEKQQEATAVHEIAHGLMEYALPGFIAATGYWTNRTTKSGAAGKEAPPTAYGNKNAAEDLCESVMFYFVDQARLKDGMPGKAKGTPGNPCPERLAYLKTVIEGWAPPTIQGQWIKGDGILPEVTDDSMVAV
jgi:hypothetical protein